jgi:hypothetical protein
MLLCLAALLAVTPAHSWYDQACCSERDCYPISADEVEALPNGDWRVKATGDLFPARMAKSMSKVRFSPDGPISPLLLGRRPEGIEHLSLYPAFRTRRANGALRVCRSQARILESLYI